MSIPHPALDPASAMKPDTIRCIDALELLYCLPDACVDCIVSDPPYGVIAMEWDKRPDLEVMWRQFKRVIKPRGAIILTASQPFTSLLTCSNLDWYRHEYIWEKPQGTGYLNANRAPMKNHEQVLVFSEGETNYYPQMIKGEPYRATSGAVGGFVRDKTVGGYVTINDGLRYPKTVLKFNAETGYHPTQKPEPLISFLIRTYSRRGDVILDPYCGSGTTALAARNTGRHYICGDSHLPYVEIARQRLAQPWTPPLFADTSPQPVPLQLSLP